mgnify:CR=1 FL=1
MTWRSTPCAAFLCLASIACGTGTPQPPPAQMAAARHHNNLGVALMDHGNQKEAITEFRAALAGWEGYVTARVNLGIVLYYSNDHGGAAEALAAALGAAPDEPQVPFAGPVVLQVEGRVHPDRRGRQAVLARQRDHI